MRISYALLLAATSVSALSACASTATSSRPEAPQSIQMGVGGNGAMQMNIASSTSPNVAHLAYPVETVWRVLPAAYDSLGIPVNANDPKTHSFGNSAISIRRQLGKVALSRYIDCGNAQGPASADTYEIQLSVTTQLSPGDAGNTIMTTTIQALGRPIAQSGDYTRCSSKGVLEPALAKIVNARLQR